MHWILWRLFGVAVLQSVAFGSAKLVTPLPHSAAAALSIAPEMLNNILMSLSSTADDNWQNVGDDLVAADDTALMRWSSAQAGVEEEEVQREGVLSSTQENAANKAATLVKETVTNSVKKAENIFDSEQLQGSALVVLDATPAALHKSNNNKFKYRSSEINNQSDTNLRNEKLSEKSSKQQTNTFADQRATTKDDKSVTANAKLREYVASARDDAGVASAVASTLIASKAAAGTPMEVRGDNATAATTNQVQSKAKLNVAKKPTKVATPAAAAAAATTTVIVAARAAAESDSSNSESSQRRTNTNIANSISTKAYLPNGFINPFGQLVAFFGSDQLQLQNYHLFFNAERHTVFQLHTSISTATTTAATSRNIERVRNVVTESLGAVFGVNTPTAMPQSNIRVEEVQLYNAASLRQSRFNPFNPTRILVHGWFGGANAAIYQQLVPAYLRLGAGNYNVFTVDWGRGAVADYLTASYRVKPVGKVLAKFIDFLQREAGIRYQDLHVVGFSMGAHIAGIAGKHVQTGRLPVIYALDPALPFFRYDRIEERVAITDADYVEVIHTSVGSYGYDWPLGHVDFYVNYGSAQPGCYFNECSHFRAYQVFAEALQPPWPDAFSGRGCDVQQWRDLIKQRRCSMSTGRQLQLGGDPKNVTALRARGGGVYYVTTTASPPFTLAAT